MPEQLRARFQELSSEKARVETALLQAYAARDEAVARERQLKEQGASEVECNLASRDIQLRMQDVQGLLLALAPINAQLDPMWRAIQHYDTRGALVVLQSCSSPGMWFPSRSLLSCTPFTMMIATVSPRSYVLAFLARMVCAGPRVCIPIADIRAPHRFLSPRLGRYGGARVAAAPFLLAVLNFARLHSLTPAVWCGFTVLVSRPPARMLCDTPCHLPSLLVCHLSVLGSRAGVLVVTCRGRSRSSYWYVSKPLSHLLRHFLHLLCFVCRMPLRCGGSICAAVAPHDHARARGARLL